MLSSLELSKGKAKMGILENGALLWRKIWFCKICSTP